jgi:hypothetical protein
MIQALKQYSGNVSAVARSMRITPRAVHMRLKSHGINAATYRIGTAFARPEDIAGSQGPRGNNS